MNKTIFSFAAALTLLAATASTASAVPPGGDVTSGPAGAPIIQVSDDPFTNPTSQHRTEVEPDTFAFGSTWVAAFQAGLSFANGSSGIGFATSTDQGHSFVHGVLPGITSFNEPAGPYAYAADSSVAFDRRDGVWLISYLAVRTTLAGVVDVLVSRSRDGVHWDLPVPVAMLNATLDKSWTVCDNSPRSRFYGNCYTEFNGPAPVVPLEMTTSTDGGLTWGAPQTPGPGNAGQPLVQPSGRVVVSYFGICAGQQQLCAISSDDGGDSWITPTPIATRTFHATRPLGLRSPPLPSAAVDRDGRIYLVWKDCGFEVKAGFGCHANDLVMSTSDDGTHWSDEQRIPIDPVGSNVDHFLPGIGVDAVSAGSYARLALTYYFLPDASCTVAPCELEVGFVSSSDGGQTWTRPDVLAGPMPLSWLAQTDTGAMVGDYISTSVLNGGDTALPAFAAGSPPDTDGTLHEAIFTVREQLRAGDNSTDNSTPPATR
jgi:hypothetical protein